MAPAGLDFLTDKYDERYWSWATTKFAVVQPHPSWSGVVMTETGLARLAVKASTFFSRTEPRIFDLRILGAFHIALFLGAIWLMLAGTRDLAVPVQLLIAVLLVVVFTDVGYAASFNSLYGQTASLLFFLWVVALTALAVRDGRLDDGLLIGFFLCAALFVASKPQECVQGPILALLGVRLAGGFSGKRLWRQPAIYLAAGLCAFAVWYYFQTPRRAIRDVARYHTVFMDLLPNSPNPAADLRELGLDEDLLRYSGVHAYMPAAPLGDPGFEERFFARFGFRKLLVFYLAHPARLYDRVRRASHRAFRLRPATLGNFERISGQPARAQSSRHSLWSTLRLAFGSRGLLWLALILGGTAFAVLWRIGAVSGRERLFREALLALVVMACLEFVVCAFADYLDDLPRHLFAFHVMFDLILIVDSAWLAQVAWARFHAREHVRFDRINVASREGVE